MDVRHQGARIGLEFPHADHWYWSLDAMDVLLSSNYKRVA
jgi:hypothetical protein